MFDQNYFKVYCKQINKFPLCGHIHFIEFKYQGKSFEFPRRRVTYWRDLDIFVTSSLLQLCGRSAFYEILETTLTADKLP